MDLSIKVKLKACFLIQGLDALACGLCALNSFPLVGLVAHTGIHTLTRTLVYDIFATELSAFSFSIFSAMSGQFISVPADQMMAH
jgi:hypothetical protein